MRTRIVPFALLTGLVSLALVACSSGAAQPAPTRSQPASPPPPPAAPAAPAAPSQPAQPAASAPSGGGTEFEISLQDPGVSGKYMFGPADLTFKVGDTITFKLTAESEFHTFTVDDLGIDVDVDGRQTVTVTHTFDTQGTFGFICVPHEALGMVGTITVN